MLIGMGKHCQKLLLLSNNTGARFRLTRIYTLQIGFLLSETGAISTENNWIITEREKY